MNGNVIPFVGNKPEVTPILINDCRASITAIPIQQYVQNQALLFIAFRAIWSIRCIKIMYKNMTIITPTNPNSSAYIEKMKSVCASGR